MRTSVAIAILACLVAGCAGSTGCPDLEVQGTIQEVTGTDLRVRLLDGEPAVLHVAGSTLLRREPDGCVPITVGEVTMGSNVAFKVDAWAESYPVQGWPETVIVG